MFAWLGTFKQSCRKIYEEQKLFNDLELEMCTTCSKVAHKSDLGAVLDLVILAKCWSRSSFLLLLFGALSFENQDESVQALLTKIVVLT